MLEPFYRFIRNQQLILILLAVLTGSAASLGAIVFRESIVLIQTVTFGASLEQMSEFIADMPGWQVVLVPTAGGLLVGLMVHYLMPGRRNRGVADVMEAVALRSGSITLREGLGAAAVSAVTIGVGASVGREGPVVHLGATLSSFVATRLRLSRSQAVTLLALAQRGGISSARHVSRELLGCCGLLRAQLGNQPISPRCVA